MLGDELIDLDRERQRRVLQSSTVREAWEDFEKENEQIQPDEAWEKPEAYFIHLVDMPSLPHRLKVWAFSFQWADERTLAEVYCRNILAAYNEIKTNSAFMMILGQVLAIGNVLNGGTAKGQADGFDLPVFTKLTSMKDA